MIQGGTVLLVEDDPTDVFLMERTFVKVQITQELLIAKNGIEAINLLSRAGSAKLLGKKDALPCLVLLDL